MIVDERVRHGLEVDLESSGCGWLDIGVTISPLRILFRAGTEPPRHNEVAEGRRNTATPAACMRVGDPKAGEVWAARVDETVVGEKGDGRGR